MNEKNENSSKYRMWRSFAKTTVVVFAAILGGVAAMLADLDSVSANLKSKCIDFGVCGPGNHFINVNIATLRTNSEEAKKLSPIRVDDPSSVLAGFSLEFKKENRSNRLVVQSVDGVTGQGQRNGFPYQVAPRPGYWAPDEFWLGWNLGFPVLDIILAEKGKKIDVTNFEISILRSEMDENPYLQIAAPAVSFASLMLSNESIHKSVSADIEFNIVNENLGDEPCVTLETTEHDFKEFRHRLTDIVVQEVEYVDLTQFLEKEVDDFRYRQFRNLLVSEYQTYSYADAVRDGKKLPKPPDGYENWEVVNPYIDPQPDGESDFTRVVYGKITSRSSQFTHKTLFCAAVPIEPPDGLGGGGISIDDTTTVKLKFSDEPYDINYDVKYRLDTDKPHFRTAIMFSSLVSGKFELKLKLKSFDRTIYESDIIELNTFVPKTTMAIARGGN